MFNIVRFYKDAGIRRRIIHRGLTLDEARVHCSSVETSSRTCTNNVGRRRTRDLGAWFDGYEEEA